MRITLILHRPSRRTHLHRPSPFITISFAFSTAYTALTSTYSIHLGRLGCHWHQHTRLRLLLGRRPFLLHPPFVIAVPFAIASTFVAHTGVAAAISPIAEAVVVVTSYRPIAFGYCSCGFHLGHRSTCFVVSRSAIAIFEYLSFTYFGVVSFDRRFLAASSGGPRP